MWKVKTLNEGGEQIRQFESQLQAIAFAISQLELDDVLQVSIAKPIARH
jgi:hypothetical protein